MYEYLDIRIVNALKKNAEKSMTRLINRAMQAPDDYIIEMRYRNVKGETTRRTVSPIRYLKGGRLLAFCLCREEPRQFYLARCSDVELKLAGDVLMPMPIG